MHGAWIGIWEYYTTLLELTFPYKQSSIDKAIAVAFLHVQGREQMSGSTMRRRTVQACGPFAPASDPLLHLAVLPSLLLLPLPHR
jgi:hypothetical protein